MVREVIRFKKELEIVGLDGTMDSKYYLGVINNSLILTAGETLGKDWRF